MAESVTEIAQRMVSGMENPSVTANNDAPVTSARYPSIAEYKLAQQEATGMAPNANRTKPVYGEEISPSLVSDAVSQDTIARAHFSSLGDKTPADRAVTGARFGARAGLQNGGLVGSLVGSGVGAIAARALGVIQSGEHEDNVRKDSMLGVLSEMGVTKQGFIDFEDAGKSMMITNDPAMRLANVSSFGEGKDRSIYDIDTSNPFANRASEVARPLGLYLAQGLMGFRDRKNPRDENAAKNAVSLLTNALSHDADSADLIFSRARKTVDKLGLDEDKLRSYFNDNKGMFEANEAAAIRSGLDKIFGVK